MLAESRRGVICTPHPAATAAGMRMLEAGGSAIDAMLAASAMLAAVYPHMTGLGGDALWMIHDRRVRTIVGIGQAGQRLPRGRQDRPARPKCGGHHRRRTCQLADRADHQP